MNEGNSSSKVAYVLGFFPLLSETFVTNEILELKGQGMDVGVFALRKSGDPVQPEAEGLVREAHYINNKSKARKIFDLLYAHAYFFFRDTVRYLKVLRFVCGTDGRAFSTFLRVSHLSLVLKKSGVGAIHTHFAGNTAEYVMLASMMTGIPYSFTPHAYDIFINPRLVREKINFADFVISKTEYNKRFLEKKYPGIDGGKIRVVRYGVDPERFAPSERNGSGRRPFTIVSVARLVEKKGIRYLLEACGILVKRGISNFVCRIIGDGPLRKELEELSSNLGLSGNVEFMGSMTSDKVLPALKDSDLFVLPCVVAGDGDMDGLPNVLIEAMALEKPVISTYISGVPELIRDGSGILVPSKDSEALALAIEGVYRLSPEERREKGKKGREIVARDFDLKKNVSEIKNLFLSSLCKG